MADITFTRTDFPQFSGLLTLLETQRLDVARQADAACHTLVYPVVGPDELPEPAALVAQARKHAAKRVVLLKVGSGPWSVTEDFGGRVLEVTLPSGQIGIGDAPMMLLSTLLARPFGGMIAADPESSALIDLGRRVAKHDVSVFINGPTGSGKEVLSRMIHDASPRAGKPFIALNCAAIPENMLEAMLFGHEKGAFTGATAPNKGHFRAADEGTLLLDEISEMPMALQAKLLRVLQEKTVTPVGSQKEVPIDIRVLATSNVDMEEAIAGGRFREDLFYRLNVFPLETLALRDRPLDIPVLAQAFLARHTRQGTAPLLRADAIALLLAHAWPGNVRELENVMQRALVLADGSDICADHILLSTSGKREAAGPLGRPSGGLTDVARAARAAQAA
ncbi:MAG: sigma-54 dependent transcriptional regulator [Pseudomonadota bacterium]